MELLIMLSKAVSITVTVFSAYNFIRFFVKERETAVFFAGKTARILESAKRVVRGEIDTSEHLLEVLILLTEITVDSHDRIEYARNMFFCFIAGSMGFAATIYLIVIV